MTEPGNPNEGRGFKTTEYKELILEIDKNPHDPLVLDKVLKLARSEEGTANSSFGFFGHVPLEEMVTVAEKLRGAETPEDKYKILAEKSSTGEFWYDIILGHTNDKSLEVLGEEIGYRKNIYGEKSEEKKWKRGLDIGSGTGNSLGEIRKHAGSVVGIDRLDFLLRAARLRPELSGVPLVTADALALPFSKEKFDLVMSNGLTFYLSNEQLTEFVDEVERVLEPGGSYFEAFVFKDKEMILPEVEMEFLVSGKGVLACLIDRTLTSKEEVPDQPSGFSIIKSLFEDKGFSGRVGLHKNKGVVVLEFQKKFPPEIDGIKRDYLSGEMEFGNNYIAYDLLYLPQNIGQATKPPKLRPTENILGLLDCFGKLAGDQKIIDAEDWGHYYLVFVMPLLEISLNEEVGGNVQDKARKLLSTNLDILYQRKVRNISDTGDRKRVFSRRIGELRESVQDKPEFEDLRAQIDKISSELK